MIYASAQKEADNRLWISVERGFNCWDVNPRLNLRKKCGICAVDAKFENTFCLLISPSLASYTRGDGRISLHTLIMNHNSFV